MVDSYFSAKQTGTGFASVDHGGSPYIALGRIYDRQATHTRDRSKPPYPYPANYEIQEYGPDHEKTEKESDSKDDLVLFNPLRIVSVDLNVANNIKSHHTDQYSIANHPFEQREDENVKPPQLVYITNDIIKTLINKMCSCK